MNTFTTPTAARTSTLVRTLDRDALRRTAPSIFAATPWHSMSDRYKFIPTIEVVDMLADEGFLPVRAQQSRSRIEGKGDFTKHMIRFRNVGQLATMAVGQEFPELVMVNSHDGTAAYHFMAGIFRIVCLNGLVVQSQDHGNVKVQHKGGSDFHDRVIDATYTIMEDAPRTIQAIETFKGIQLNAPQQEAFAAAAAELRDNEHVKPRQLLQARRVADAVDQEGNRDLWKTMNAVQENIMKGGVRGFNPETRKRFTTREVKSVDADVKTNKALWTLTEKMAQLAK